MLIATTALVAAMTHSAHAQETPAAGNGTPALPSEAEVRIAQGELLFAAENYDAALVEFEAAYELLADHPGAYLLLFNVGQCHERLFRYDEALSYYERYLSSGGSATEDAVSVRATIAALESLLGALRVVSNVPGVVWVDDREIGPTGEPLRVTGGPHAIEIRATGYASERSTVQVPARREVLLEVVLHETSDFHGVDPVFFWTSLGTTLAAGAVWAVFGGLALAANGDARALAGRDDALRHQAGIRAANEDATRSALVSDVTLGVAGALALTTIVLGFVTQWSQPRLGEAPGSAALARLTLRTTGVGLALDGTF